MLQRFAIVCLGLLLTACNTPSGPPVLRQQAWNFQLPVPAVAPDRDQTLSTIVWAGGMVREMTPSLAVQGLSGPLAEVRLSRLDGSLVRVWRSADVAADGSLPGAPAVAAAALRLAVSTPAGQPWPRVTLRSMAVREQATAPETGAFRLQPGDVVDAWFPEAGRPLFLFVPAGTAAVDILAWGDAELRLADPAFDTHVLDPAAAWDRLQPSRPGTAGNPPGGWLRVAAPVVAASRGLRLTWEPMAGAASGMVARVAMPGARPGRKLAFPARDRDAFFAHWFGVDRDGAQAPACPYGPLDPRSASCQLDKLRCTNHAGVSGLVSGPGGIVAPRVPVVCYDTHTGTDFGLRGAVIGQALGVDVAAAQDGVVVFANDGNPDKCFASPVGGFSCVGSARPLWDELTSPAAEPPANRVGVLQDDGHLAWYFHLRRGTVAVVPGQRLRCGDRIGQVGSSGISSGPHLHFELRTRRDNVDVLSLDYASTFGATDTVDPFPGLWADWSEGRVPGTACPP